MVNGTPREEGRERGTEDGERRGTGGDQVDGVGPEVLKMKVDERDRGEIQTDFF